MVKFAIIDAVALTLSISCLIVTDLFINLKIYWFVFIAGKSSIILIIFYQLFSITSRIIDSGFIAKTSNEFMSSDLYRFKTNCI